MPIRLAIPGGSAPSPGGSASPNTFVLSTTRVGDNIYPDWLTLYEVFSAAPNTHRIVIIEEDVSLPPHPTAEYDFRAAELWGLGDNTDVDLQQGFRVAKNAWFATTKFIEIDSESTEYICELDGERRGDTVFINCEGMDGHQVYDPDLDVTTYYPFFLITGFVRVFVIGIGDGRAEPGRSFAEVAVDSGLRISLVGDADHETRCVMGAGDVTVEYGMDAGGIDADPPFNHPDYTGSGSLVPMNTTAVGLAIESYLTSNPTYNEWGPGGAALVYAADDAIAFDVPVLDVDSLEVQAGATLTLSTVDPYSSVLIIRARRSVVVEGTIRVTPASTDPSPSALEYPGVAQAMLGSSATAGGGAGGAAGSGEVGADGTTDAAENRYRGADISYGAVFNTPGLGAAFGAGSDAGQTFNGSNLARFGRRLFAALVAGQGPTGMFDAGLPGVNGSTGGTGGAVPAGAAGGPGGVGGAGGPGGLVVVIMSPSITGFGFVEAKGADGAPGEPGVPGDNAGPGTNSHGGGGGGGGGGGAGGAGGGVILVTRGANSVPPVWFGEANWNGLHLDARGGTGGAGGDGGAGGAGDGTGTAGFNGGKGGLGLNGSHGIVAVVARGA